MKLSSPAVMLKSIITSLALMLAVKTIARVRDAKSALAGIADFFNFTLRVIKETFSRSFEFKEFFRQCFYVGNKSLPLVSIAGIIMGFVLTVQARPVLIKFGAVAMLPSMVVISIIREMGPVIVALICAGKIGSGMGAELASMKVSEQIDAMEISSTNPINYLVVTRVLAAMLMIPLLILYSDALGLFGSWLGANIKGEISFVLFFTKSFSHLEFIDFLPAFIKSFLFGAVIGMVGCYKGLSAGRGTESVGIAANSAVVLASLLVILTDMIAVQITDMLI